MNALKRQSNRLRPRGIAAMIAMLMLLIFSTLALGFYASVTTSVQVSYNDRNANGARAAAESGMEFIRYQLNQINIGYGVTNNQVMPSVYAQLQSLLNNTANLGQDQVGFNGVDTITIPANTSHWIASDGSGSQFQIVIVQSGSRLVTRVRGMGRDGVLQRAIEMKYDPAQRASGIFSYGVASRGSISLIGHTSILGATDPTRGSILAATTQPTAPALTMSGNTQVSGDASFVLSNPVTSYSGPSTLAGFAPSSSGFSQHVHNGVQMPTFPTIDTTVFEPYVTGGYYTSGNTLVNQRLKAGKTYNFTGNTTIQGILYIETPCNITFSGNLTIQGCIIVQNTATNPATGNGNTISFSGNVSATGIDTLPATSSFPAQERALTGVFVAAPTCAVSFTGNFGTIGGSILADSVSFTGNAGGTVTGTVVGMKDAPLTLNGNSDILIAGTGTTKYPPGVYFGQNYVPAPDTYMEVDSTPWP